MTKGPFPVFALLTDFGVSDPYAGQMKAVLLSRAGGVPVVDISHGVPPFSVSAGAFFLAASRRFFPKGTVFIAVVDPGVGSERALLCIQGKDHFLLGPDNGLLSLACRDMAKEGAVTAYEIAIPEKPPHPTFHGRDILAPAAARLAGGAEPSELGPPLRSPLRLPAWAEPEIFPSRFGIAILHVDRFGNCITNLPNSQPLFPGDSVLFDPARGRRAVLAKADHYAMLEPGAIGIIPGGQGYYEIAGNMFSAAGALGLTPGDAGAVTPARES